MIKKMKSLRTTFLTIVFTLFAIIFINICAEKIKGIYVSQVITDNAKVYYNNKLLVKGKVSYYMLRHYKYGSEIVIKTKVKKGDINYPVITFNNNINAGIRIYIDNKIVYEYGMNAPKNSVVCNDNMKIPLKENCYNKNIKIILRCTNTGVFARIPNIYYMNTKEADLRNMIGNLAFEIGGIVLICLGLVTIALFIFNLGVDVTIKQIIYVSIASLCGGLWILSCYQLLNIFVDSFVVDFYVEYIAMYLMLLFFNFYVSETTNIKSDKKFLRVMRYLWLIYAIIAFSLQIMNIWYMNDSITGLQANCIPTIICLLRYYIKKLSTNRKGYAILYGSALITCVITIFYCISHFLKTSISLLSLIPILVFFFIISGIINTIMDLKKAYDNRAEKDALVELAYIDNLTGLYNRRGLKEFEKKVVKQESKKYKVYSIDLNRLKYINDTYGHAVGDKLIMDFASNLKSVVEKNCFCGRMGGDEFVVIEGENSDLQVELKNRIDEYNKVIDGEYKLGYSIGTADYCTGGKVSLEYCISMADYNMYEMKSMYHRKHN